MGFVGPAAGFGRREGGPVRLSSRHGGAAGVGVRRCVTVKATAAPEVGTTKEGFLSEDQVNEVVGLVGTPTFVYDLSSLRTQAAKALAFQNSYGMTVRYAMKACPNAAILKVFHDMGLKFDASSVYEAARARAAGIPAENICISSQQLDAEFGTLVDAGVEINCCSLSQLDIYGQLFPGTEVGVRFNPGLGSGGTTKTNVGGPAASFGVWHELKDKVKAIADGHGLKIVRVHSHIGSGSDPAVWERAVSLTLNLARGFPDVRTVNLGGGYKVGRMPDERSTDLSVISAPVRAAFEQFADETGRELHLEIEPGTFLVANAGSLLTRVQDVVDTGADGYKFIKLDSGMTELLRPSLYGAQHPITVIPKEKARQNTQQRYVIVGHCCESGDLMTPRPGDSETIDERVTVETKIGDIAVVGGAGAYCSGMSAKNYNSFPEVPEVLVDETGKPHVIRKRQTLPQIIANEVPAPSNL